MNPAVAARAEEIARQRAAEQAEQSPQQQNSGTQQPQENRPAPAQTANPQGNAPLIGQAPQPPKDLFTNIGGKQIPKTVPKSAKVGRNDPCPCGSGKKYKNCCGKV